jgi:hypothetical protein
MTRWINTFEDTCRDPSRENECLGWHEARITAALKTPGYVSARVYRMKATRNGRGQFITIYEIDSDDIAATMALSRAQAAASGGTDSLMMPLWENVLWKEIAAVPADLASRKTGNWVNLIEINCADPRRENEFNTWYHHTHLPDTVKTPGFLAARRYKAPAFVGGRADYLALYEIDTDDIDRTITLRRGNREKEKALGRYADASLFLRVWEDVLAELILERRAGVESSGRVA